MSLFGADRSRQVITVGVGALLSVVMGAVLLVGSRVATRVTRDVGGLETASTLQTYPATLTQQLASLRDRLEARAYSGQALADLRATSEAFNRDLQRLAADDLSGTSELEQATQLWHQYQPVLEPVNAFTGQPYIDSDASGSALSKAGREHYADVKRAQLFSQENSGRLHTELAALATRLQAEASESM